MKKTLVLSIVASTMIMAGGDIAPVEPAVAVPAPVATPAPVAVAPVAAPACGSGWKYAGQGVAYYQTRDNWGNGDLFDKGLPSVTEGASQADLGLSLKASNDNIWGGIGGGAKLIGLGSADLANRDVVSGVMENPSAGVKTGAALTEAYLSYKLGNTTLKAGRQELPLALSPFAYSEGWNVFPNTFEAATLVNTDLPQTTLVGAWVRGGNKFTDMSNFARLNGGDGVYMLTAQNKSIDGLTLTGSVYHADDMVLTNDVNIGWLDAGFKLGDYGIGLQGGQVMSNGFINDTTAYGAKVTGTFGIFDAMLAYSDVNDGDLGVKELGAGVKTPLYTQMILNQDAIFKDSSTIVAQVGAKALGGKFTLAYDYSDLGAAAPRSTFSNATAGGVGNGAGKYQELDAIYTTKIGCVDVFGAYVMQKDDRLANDTENFIRTWARYNF